MPATDRDLEVTTFSSRLGWIALASADHVLAGLAFGYATSDTARAALRLPDGSWSAAPSWPDLAERLTAYAAGEPEDFADVAVDLSHLTPFERRVVENCRRIPFGQTLSYGRLAEQVGSPRAARAVGNVMAGNRCPLVVPCHRVVAAGGRIGNYSAPEGRRMKLRLLEQEGGWPISKPAAALVPANG